MFCSSLVDGWVKCFESMVMVNMLVIWDECGQGVDFKKEGCCYFVVGYYYDLKYW